MNQGHLLIKLACALLLSVALNVVHAGVIAIKGATVIDATGDAPQANTVVLIEDDRIVSVGKVGRVDIPEDATIIDGRGKFVIPGLMDANLHLFLNIDLETLIKYEGRYDEIIIEAAQITLRSGQTTVFDTWGPRSALVKARDAINSGASVGSRIYLAGNIIGFDGPLSADFRGAAAAHVSKAFANRTNETWQQGTGRQLMWMTPDSVREEIERYATTGIDFLKYGASGHVDMQFISFSPRVQKVIIDVGHAAGMTVQTHTTSVESLDMALNAGVDIITHGDISGPEVAIPEETINKMVELGIACSVLPITQRRLDALLALDPASPEAFVAPYMKIGRENQKKMIAGGVSMLLSTDAGIENPILAAESKGVQLDPRTKLGEGHFHALEGLEELGLEPMDILQAATSNIAKAYKLDRDVGTIEAGKLADIVILNENPLKGAEHYRSIDMVIKQGKIVDITALPNAPIISAMKPPSD